MGAECLPTVEKQEEHALKLLDMIGVILRSVSSDDVDIMSLLSSLDKFYENIGIKTKQCCPLLISIDKALQQFFPDQYTVEIKFAFEEIFKWIAKRMMHITDVSFLKSFKECMESFEGRQILYSYLCTQWSEEVSVFLVLLDQFKKQKSDISRYGIAERMLSLCIEPKGQFVLKTSRDDKETILKSMRKMRKKHNFQIASSYFNEIEKEIHRLIQQKHWFKFIYFVKSKNIS